MTIIELANKASKIPGVKFLLKPFYYRYKTYLKNRQVEVFKKNGMKVIEEFDKMMTDSGYAYFLIFGSMLGAIREHGLIKHDLDLDTAMWYEDADENLLFTLEKAGFKLVHSFEIDGGKSGREWTFLKDGVSVDIFFVYRAIRDNPYCCDFPIDYETTGCVSWNQMMKKCGGVIPRRVELPFSKVFKRVPYENLFLPIPENADEILRIHYGANYMIPIKNWSRDEKTEPATHLVMWKDKLAIYSEFH